MRNITMIVTAILVLWFLTIGAHQEAVGSEIKQVRFYSGRSSDIGKFTKLQGLALEVGAKLVGRGDLKEASGVMAFSGWGGWNASVTRMPAEALLDIDTFVKNGGRAVVFMTSATIDQMNPLLADLYQLALAKERIVNKPNLVLPGDAFFPFWRNLRVGCGTSGNYQCQILSYIAGRIPENAVLATLKSEQSGRDRPISVQIKHGRGTLWVSHSSSIYGGGDACRISGAFFHDSQIDRLDNSQAARRLIKWLVSGD